MPSCARSTGCSSAASNLLEWRTASQAHKAGDNDIRSYYGMMYGAVIIGVRRPCAIPVLADSTGAFVAFFFALFWIGSPAFAWLDQPLGRDRGPARIIGDADAPCAAHHRAPHLALFRDLRDGRAQQSAARQFPGSAAPVVAPPHLADQYRRLSAVGGLGPRFRLDQPVRRHHPHRRHDDDHREHAAPPRPSLQLVRHDDAEAAVSALYLGGRQRQSRRPLVPWRPPATNGRRPRPSISRAISTASLDTVAILEEKPGRAARRPPPAAAVASAPAGPHRRHAARRRDDQGASPRWRRSAPSIWR